MSLVLLAQVGSAISAQHGGNARSERRRRGRGGQRGRCADGLADRAIDVLVTDVNLPGMSGPELAAKARALNPSVGIVFATGDAQSVAEQQGERTILLTKPYDGVALAAAVRAALGKTDMPVTRSDPVGEREAN